MGGLASVGRSLVVNRLLRPLEWIVEKLGMAGAWLVVPLTVVVAYQVVMRYLFRAPPIWGFDVSWMLFAAMFLLGGGYTLLRDRHVRVDIVLRLLPPRGQAFVETIFFAVLFCPVTALLTWRGWEFAARSWATGEHLSTTLWHFPAAPIKTFVPLAFALLTLQGVILLIRNIAVLIKGKPQ